MHPVIDSTRPMERRIVIGAAAAAFSSCKNGAGGAAEKTSR